MASNNNEVVMQNLSEINRRFFKKPLKFHIILCASVSAFILFVAIYLGLVRFTVYSLGLRFLIGFLFVIWFVPYIKIMRDKKLKALEARGTKGERAAYKRDYKPKSRVEAVFFGVVCCAIFFFLLSIVLNIASWEIFSAKSYRNLIKVSTSTDFVGDVQEFNDMKVPIVDKAYAQQLGDKHLGEEVGLGSQFRVSDYTLIEHNGNLYWVGALEHSNLFTWMSNLDGTPGYIRVNAANPSDVTLVRTHRLKYVPSAFFSQDLMRKAYFSSMGKSIADRVSFELDASGVPHYVFSVIERKVALTGGSNTIGILTLDATCGEVSYFDIDEIPNWVNHAYPTEEVNQQLNWWGHYVHGFFNSVFAKKEVMQISEGYNYIYNNGGFYLYTGMTSTGDDESIIGVVLVDLRTKANSKLYLTGGLTEYAAQEAARGVFQAHNYYATFPLLINYHNEPTYLVLLKDNAGFVKQYAFVNLKDLSKYGTGDSLAKAELEYQRNIALSTGNRLENAQIVSLSTAVKGNNTVYFLIVKDENGNLVLDRDGSIKIFEASITISNKLPFLEVGDIVSFDYTNEYIQTISYVQTAHNLG